MRYCKVCQSWKPESEYWKNGKWLRSQCKKCHSDYNKRQYQKLKAEVLSHYGKLKCSWCGENDLRYLCLDHMNGGGRKHLKSIGLYSSKHNKILSGIGFYLYLRRNNYPNDPPLQVLCLKCNQNKQIINEER